MLTCFRVGPLSPSHRLTIEMLFEDILLNIFRHCLDAAPHIWPVLTWVCQRWRQIIFASLLGLNIGLHCTHGTPVLRSLDRWPVLPIIVKYGGVPNLDPPAPDDDDNIIAALKQSGRVNSINLTITGSLLEKLSAISEPLSELEELVLLAQDNAQRTFPSTFRWGLRLRTLNLTRITFPSLQLLLSPCQALVDLQLHEIPSSGYISPEAFTNALSGAPQLRSLTLHLLSFPPRRSYLGLPPSSGERTTLAALTHLKYRGTSKYLDTFVGRINAPSLEDIEITLFSQPTMDASQLGRFIGRLEMRKSLIHAFVGISRHNIYIASSSKDTNAHVRVRFKLRISCQQLDWQLSCMAQVCDRVSPYLFRVGEVEVCTTKSLCVQDEGNGEKWSDLLRSFKFSGAEDFFLIGHHTKDILCALHPADEGSTLMLPSLRGVQVREYIKMGGPLWDSVQSFVTSRWISGRPVKIDAPFYRCHICHSRSEDQEGLKCHLRNKHGYQILCSYCGQFECTLTPVKPFRKHLKREHPEITPYDTRSSKISLRRLQCRDLINRHGSLRAPDVVPVSPAELHSRHQGLDSPIAWGSHIWPDITESDTAKLSYWYQPLTDIFAP